MSARPLIHLADLSETYLPFLRSRFGDQIKVAATVEQCLAACDQFKDPVICIDMESAESSREVASFLNALKKREYLELSVWGLTHGFCRLENIVPAITVGTEFFVVRSGCSDPDEHFMPDSVIEHRGVRVLPKRHEFATPSSSLWSYMPELGSLFGKLRRVAPLSLTVLITGETGTGKTTLAEALHNASAVSAGPFIHLACGTVSRELIASELFGHSRGAFTGAEQSRVGRFEAANDGTLLLDEIDLLSHEQQASLLRVIETGEYETVGSSDVKRSNARIIVASNVDLENLVQQGKFRSDLFYRLNVVELNLPALRHRRVDLLPLAVELIEASAHEFGTDIDLIEVDCLKSIALHGWPGNLRELRNQMRRIVLMEHDGALLERELAPSKHGSVKGSTSQVPDLLSEQVEDLERKSVMAALNANEFNRTKTAAHLGISRVGLYKKMKRLGMMHLPLRPTHPPSLGVFSTFE